MGDQMAEAMRRQMAHAQRAAFVDRRGWSDDEWIADARSLMNDLDGAVTSLVNGHVLALLRRADQMERGETVWWCEQHGQASIPSDADADDEEANECAGAWLGWHYDCSMSERVLVSPSPNEDAE